MATVAFSSTDVLLTAANVLYAPMATALPDETTVAYNTLTGWAAAWVHLGYTATPAQITYSYDVTELFVEQSTAPILQRKNNERVTIDIELSQFSGTNLALLFAGTNTATAAGASQKAFSQVVSGGDPVLDEYMFALEGVRPDAAGIDQPVRVFIHRGTIRASGAIQFAKAGGTTLPAQITGLLKSSLAVGSQLMEIHIVTSATV
jgi:hypothetical protein